MVVAPGGMKEALRPREERYRYVGSGFGFTLRTGAPLVMAACPKADDLMMSSIQTYSTHLRPISPDPNVAVKAPEDCCHVALSCHIYWRSLHRPKSMWMIRRRLMRCDALHAQCTEVMTGLLQNDSTDEDSR